MTAIFVFLMFVSVLGVEFYLHRKQVPAAQPPVQERKPQLPRVRPQIAAGFEVPENLLYHPGHTWALAESPSLVRVGIDDFAAKFLGKSEKINTPQRGQWVRQGQKIFSFFRDGKVVEMVSPIEGEVTDLNDAALQNPELAHTDCYGTGWLMTVQAPDARTMFRNLIGGNLVARWTEDTATRLAAMMPNATGMALAQDGGTASHDIGRELPEEKYAEAVREFFLG